MPNTTVSQLQFENTGELLDIKPLVDYIYPVGAIYMSATQINPATLFGGTWEQIQDTFLLCAGSLYAGGTTGGTASNAHTHTMAHTHSQVATTSGGPSVASTGGPSSNSTSSVGLSVAQMPSHNHGSAGSHTHNLASRYGDVVVGVPAGSGAAYANVGNHQGHWLAESFYAASSGAHTHSSNGSGSGHSHTLNSHTHSMQSHTHSTSATTTGAASNSTTSAASASDNMPPYLAVYVYKRTA